MASDRSAEARREDRPKPNRRGVLTLVIGRFIGLYEKSAATRRVSRRFAGPGQIEGEITPFWTQLCAQAHNGRVRLTLLFGEAAVG